MKRPLQPSLFSDHADSTRRGSDEMNFAEFPMALLTERAPDGQNELVFQDVVTDHGNGGKPVIRELRISAPESYGLPTAKDEEVLLGLLAMTKLRTNFADPSVTFTRYELLTLLGWATDGRAYQRLVDSLNRWAGVFLHYKNAWWDNDRQVWLDVSFHVIDSVMVSKPRKDENGGQVQVQWNSVTFKSFQANYLRQLDLGFCQSLGSAVSKRLFRYLDKHFYKRARLEYDLLTLAFEHVGLSRDYEPWKVKQKLAPAITELEERGYLAKLGPKERYLAAGKGKWKVVFNKAQAAIAPPAAEEPVPAVPALVTALTDRGVSAKSAKALVAKLPADRIERQVEAFSWLVGKKDRRVSKSPAGYLVKAIEEDFALPAGFEPESVRRKRAEDAKRKDAEETQLRRADAERVKAEDTARQKATDDYLAALTDAQRERFVSEAIADGERFVAERYTEAVRNNNQKAATRYLAMLVESAVARADSKAISSR